MADKDSDDEHGSPAPPHTPPAQRRARPGPPYPFSRDHSDAAAAAAASPTHLSPPASPPMSLYSLRMSPLSPLFPPSNSGLLGPEHEDREGVTQNSREALVQRLNGLAARLSRQHHVEDSSINVLHAKVDELENVLSKRRTRPRQLPPRSPGGDDQDESDFSLEPPHPGSLLPSDVSSLASPTRPSASGKAETGHQAHKKAKSRRTSKMTVAEAERVVAEARDLHKSLEVVISNLRDRQEETEHIHALLITRLERAAQRIIELEEQLQDLEIQRKEGETELLNLRIQLKAIEVQCLSYVPKDADPELSASIDAWKMEWSARKQRRARDKENSFSSYDTPTRRRPPPAAR
ncbi:hypothetical protein F4859DRAFT_102971 [Xylaria cf. heliscus]|nr:hypothetical protein F4859DRAFT_102971 [Xylaria cf. heliscus]